MRTLKNALETAIAHLRPAGGRETKVQKGLGIWLIDRIRRRSAGQSRMSVLEQIRVSPRQSLLLVEVEGERVLLATSDAGTPAFYPLRKPADAKTRRKAVGLRVEGICA